MPGRFGNSPCKRVLDKLQTIYSEGVEVEKEDVAIDVKIVFTFSIIFIKRVLKTFSYVLNVLYFLVAKILILLNLLNSYIKRLLSDGFNVAAIGNSLHEGTWLSNAVMHIIRHKENNFTGNFII